MALGFADSIRLTAEKQLAEVDKKVEGVAVELFTAVVNFSPNQIKGAIYSKGEFINNWHAARNGEDLSNTGWFSDTGEGSRLSIAGIKAAKTFYRRDGFVTLSNSTPYAELVEYKGWPTSINPAWIRNLPPYAPVRSAWSHVVPKFKV